MPPQRWSPFSERPRPQLKAGRSEARRSIQGGTSLRFRRCPFKPTSDLLRLGVNPDDLISSFQPCWTSEIRPPENGTAAPPFLRLPIHGEISERRGPTVKCFTGGVLGCFSVSFAPPGLSFGRLSSRVILPGSFLPVLEAGFLSVLQAPIHTAIALACPSGVFSPQSSSHSDSE